VTPTPISIYFPQAGPGAQVALANAFGVGAFTAETGSDPDATRLKELGEAAAAGGEWRVAQAPEQADVCVYPTDYRDDDEFARRAIVECKQRGLPLMLFRNSDDSTPVHLDHGVICRESIEASRQTTSERAMPALCNDMLRHVPGGVRQKQAKPTLGFCGFVGSSLKRMYYGLTGRRQKVVGLNLRHRVVKRLEADAAITCKFILRTSFYGGAMGRFHRNVNRAAEVRREYLENILGTDYTVCLRGKGNFSYRFYEVLSAGRIPVFVNTDCALPFADRIDWRRHCVWVEEGQIDRAGEIVREFHDRLSPEQFVETQRANRTLWLDWMSPLGFHRQILRDAVRERRAKTAG
jgi:hypothetical protein